jgi:hypothetical protein
MVVCISHGPYRILVHGIARLMLARVGTMVVRTDYLMQCREKLQKPSDIPFDRLPGACSACSAVIRSFNQCAAPVDDCWKHTGQGGTLPLRDSEIHCCCLSASCVLYMRSGKDGGTDRWMQW